MHTTFRSPSPGITGNNTLVCIAYGLWFVYIRSRFYFAHARLLCNEFVSGQWKKQCGAPTTGSPSVEDLPSSLQQQSSGLLKTILQNIATMLGYEQLKKEQEESITEFITGRDVFVSLPTGFRKSLFYTLLPSVFDQLRKVERKSIALVVSPLVALMQDQVTAITAMGISATLITDKHTKTTAKQ